MTSKGWTSNSNHWKSLPPELMNSTWKVRPLAQSYSTSIPDTSGVYVICTRPPHLTANRQSPRKTNLFHRLYNAVYTGSSSRLRNRFLDHSGNHPQAEIKNARDCYAGTLEFWYHLCSQENLRDWEGHLQLCLGPSANIATVIPRQITGRISGVTDLTTGEYRSFI